MREYKYAVFIGRFQPLHNGHVAVINEALTKSEKIIILIGSSNIARSPKNPWTYDERVEMFNAAIVSGGLYNDEGTIGRFIFRPLPDNPYNDTDWAANTQKIIHDAVLEDMNVGSPSVKLHGINDAGKIAIVGFEKDSSSFYLKMFPTFSYLKIKSQWSLLSATDIRDDYLRPASRLPESHLVPRSTTSFLTKFLQTDHFKWLVQEKEYYDGYKKMWEGSPFPVSFQCVDAVVTQGSNILLVKRKFHPGKGLWAMPGGHLKIDKTLLDSAIDELKEETAIESEYGSIPRGILASYIKKEKNYDDPNRSLKGRVLTTAYHFDLPLKDKLYKVKGMDDAEKASWHELGTLRADQFHDDHAFIIEDMLGININ